MNNKKWNQLSVIAWKNQKNARILGKTKVGAAVISGKNIFGGCLISKNDPKWECNDCGHS